MHRPRDPDHRSSGPSPSATSSVLALLVAGVVFATVLVLVTSAWSVVRRMDVAAIDALNSFVHGQPWLVKALHTVTDLGGSQTSRVLIPLAVGWLVIRRQHRLAAFVAVTGIGAWALTAGVKALVDRARPTVEVAVATVPDASFPSGHALGSTVTYGVLLLVFLPVVPARLRRAVTAATVALVVAIGLTRIALGVHFPTDVIGGWSLGVVWLGVTTTALRHWRADESTSPAPLREGLEPEERSALEPAPAHDDVLPHGVTSAARLAVAVVLLTAAVAALGEFLTDVVGHAVRTVEVAVVAWLVSIRTDTLTTLAVVVGHAGSRIGIVVLLVVAAALALAVTRRWTPPAFLLVVVAGETAIFLAVVSLVSRMRPPVQHLTPTLPPTSSFPSGHVAAATVAYVSIALLVRAWSDGWLPRLASVVAVVVPVGVALSRLYRGAHYPTDVITSMVYGLVWVAICWHVLRPGAGASADTGSPGEPTGTNVDERTEVAG